MIEQLAGILEPGDVVIDAGNSRFHDSKRHAAELAAQGLEWLDMGVSGGVWGLQVGFCAMLGGKREVFDRFEPVVRTLAPEDGYLYCGDAGAGPLHEDGPQRDRVRDHAGLRRGLRHPPRVGLRPRPGRRRPHVEQRLGHPLLAARAGRQRLRARAATTSTASRGWVADSGEGRWTVAEAIDHDVPAPVITLSLIERFRSRRTPDSYSDRVLAALRNEFGGHAIKERE